MHKNGIIERGIICTDMGKNIFLPQSLHTVCGSHTACYPLEYWGDCSPRIERPERDIDRSPPASADIQSAGSYTSTLRTSSWRGT
jgi:hypothetical protein